MVVSYAGLRRFSAKWLPLLLWMAAIFVVSGRPAQDLPTFGVLNFLVKKGSHFLAYAVMALLAWRVTRDWRVPQLWAFALTALYAISDEWHQTFVPSRNGTLVDVLIDSAGAITALLLLRRWRRRRIQRG